MSRPVHILAQVPIIPARRSYSEIDRDEIVRQTLEEAAKRIETYGGNKIYQTAWRKASLLIRSMKP